MNIRWTRAALADLENILTHAAARNTLEADNISRRVMRTEQAIAMFPEATFHNADKNYYERVVPRTRVILIYRIEGEDVIMHAAFHTSQNPTTKLGH